MLNEEEFKGIISKLINDVKVELASPVQKIFEEENLRQAIMESDVLAFEDSFYRGLRKWIPTREKLAAIISSGIFLEVAMQQYGILKNKEFKEKDNENFSKKAG